MKVRLAFVIFSSLLALAACDRSGQKKESPEPVAVDPDDPWVRHILHLRASKDQSFQTSATSPMAGTQFLKSQPGNAVYLTHDGAGRFDLAYAAGPQAVFSLTGAGDSWTWHREADDVVAKKSAEVLVDDAPVDRTVTFAVGRFTVSIYPQQDTVTFKTFDPERTEFKTFKHLEYFPPDRQYAVSATLVEFETHDEVVMLTSQNLDKPFYRYARVKFQIDGQAQELTAFKYALSGPDSDALFIPFKDATTGEDTYGAGRYLDARMPEKQPFPLDFNEAYNPLCNYSSAYNCPIPPRENHLQVAIRAGEKTYPH